MSNKHEFKGSKAISHIDYHDEDGHLEICFGSGSTHRYKCDKSVYDEMKACESAGKFFHSNVKNHFKEVKND